MISNDFTPYIVDVNLNSTYVKDLAVFNSIQKLFSLNSELSQITPMIFGILPLLSSKDLWWILKVDFIGSNRGIFMISYFSTVSKAIVMKIGLTEDSFFFGMRLMAKFLGCC